MNLIQQMPAILIGMPLLAAFLTPIIDRISKKFRNGFVIAVLILEEIFMIALFFPYNIASFLSLNGIVGSVVDFFC